MTAEQLRNSILQEAISGRLVPQDPNDEPASILLQRIREEKARLVKEGKLKKKDLVETPIMDDEKPFEIPDSWEWCRIHEISQSYIGLTYSPTDVSEDGIIVLRSSNIKSGKLTLNDIVRVKKEINEKLQVALNDIIICARNGSRKLVGKSALITEMSEPMTFGAFMAICKTPFYSFVYQFLQSNLFFSQLRKVSDTTTINQLTQNNFNSFLLPLPPLAEQKRIVAKLEELLPIVEQYGKAQKELDELNDALPARLRQSILQEAFKGKLTHADTTEWIEENLGKIADFLYGFPFQANMFNEEKNGKPIIRIRNIVPSWTRTYSTEICDEKYLITKGDMLVGMDGNFNVRFWKGEDAYLNQRVCRITAHVGKLHQKYLYYYLPVYLQELEENVSRTTVGHLSDKHLRNMPIPRPPLAEQQRIVAKIEELFAEIDKITK